MENNRKSLSQQVKIIEDSNSDLKNRIGQSVTIQAELEDERDELKVEIEGLENTISQFITSQAELEDERDGLLKTIRVFKHNMDSIKVLTTLE